MQVFRLHNLRQLFFLVVLIFSVFSAKASTYYWVGNGGDWMNFNQHWATTTGGSIFYSQVPGPTDDVVFDINSFTLPNQFVTTETDSLVCRNMNWSGVMNNPTFGDVNSFYYTTLNIYASVTLNPTMSWGFLGNINFKSGTGGNSINTFNLPGLNEVHFDSSTGTWTFTNDFQCVNLFLDRGTVRTGNYSITTLNNIETISNAAVSFLCGTSMINSGNSMHLNSTLLNIDGDSATFTTCEFNSHSSASYRKINITGSNPLTVIGDNLTVDTLEVLSSPNMFNLESNASTFSTFYSQASSILYNTNTFGNATFYNNVTTDANNTFDTLSLFNVGYSSYLKAGSNTTINNTILTSGGCYGTVILRSTAAAVQANIIKASGVLTTNYILLRDINATGGATFIANNSYSISNVNGWTVNPSPGRTLYWVGNTGSWNDAAHWSLTSGGSGGNCIPGVNDDVIFNSNSFSSGGDTLYLNVGQANCKNMNWSGLSLPVTVWNNLQTTDALGIYAALNLPSNVNWGFSGTIVFASNTTGNSITTSGNVLAYTQFDGTGSWNITDSLHCSTLDVQAGNFYSVNHKLHFQFFKSSGSVNRSIHFGTSIVNCQDFFIVGSNMTIAIDSSTIYAESIRTYISAQFGKATLRFSSEYPTTWPTCRLEGQGSSFKTFTGRDFLETFGFTMTLTNALFKEQTHLGGGFINFGKVECRKDLTSDVSFFADTIYLNNPSYTVTFGQFSNINANHFLTSSNSCSGYITIQTIDPYQPAQINIPSGVVNCSYVILNGIHAVGGATFNAISSVILTNVTGWNILSAPIATTYYWVGGTGNWSAGSHWSTTSGGAGGICIPTSLDNVIFDANSFLTVSDTVYLDLSSDYCHNMTWQSVTGNPVVNCNNPLCSNFSLLIYGNLVLDPNVIWNYTGKLMFTGSGITKTVFSAGVFLDDVYFNGPASTWSLLDSIHCQDFYLENGYLKTSGHNLTADFFCSLDDSIKLGTSRITTQYFLNNATDLEFSGDSSHIDCSFFEAYGQHYNDVQLGNNFLPEFYGQHCIIRNFTAITDMRFLAAVNDSFTNADFSGRASISGSHVFGNANFHGPVYLSGNNIFNTLQLNNAGDSVVLQADSIQTINVDLFSNAISGSPISFYSTIAGTQAFLPCNGNQVCLEYTNFTDIQSNGTAAVYAGNFSVNYGNNAGIIFTACPPPSSNVWPGDANNDLITDNSDVLNIGIAFNQTGFTRPGATLSYTSQNCYDWSAGSFINLQNFNHADCDGNGIIDSTDLAAVYLNYGQSHIATIAPPPGNIISPRNNYDLWLDPAVNYYSPTDFVTIPVKLGTPTNQVNSMYGVAYTITYDNTKIVNGSVYMTYPSTWFTPNGNRVSFQLDNFAAGQIDDAQTRTNATTISGDGTIAYLHLQISPSAFGAVVINISGITAVDQFGNPVTLVPTGTILYIGPLSVAQNTIAPDVQLFPNPTTENATLTYSLQKNCNVGIDLFDINGKCVYHESKPESSVGEYAVLIPMEKLDAGIYFCRFTTGENVQTIKLVKTK